ncbi:MAG TPA: DUF3574 domain-containing protein [Clostridia bacterium]|nr:DUF3574 domain-containing protein [Clostridia bacterium]
MVEHKKRGSRIVVILLIANLLVTGTLALRFFQPSSKADTAGKLDFIRSEAGQYVLYIGTNDKDSYAQIIPTDQARRIVNGICEKYVSGYTAMDAQGGWADEKGVWTHENTLVYVFSEATEEQIRSIMNEVLEALNQGSILVEKRDLRYTFYDGGPAL